jgi:AAA domain-containing protein
MEPDPDAASAGEGAESGAAGEGAEPDATASGAATPSDAVIASGAGSDPWLALDDPTASPARVDAAAKEQLGRFAPDDVRRSAGLTSWLVRRAAADGSTVLDGTIWAAALRGYGIEAPRPGLDAAAAAGRVVVLSSERALAHPEWGRLEEQLADDVLAILASGGPDQTPDDPFEAALSLPLCVVAAGRGSDHGDWTGRLEKRAQASGRPLTVVDQAHRLDLVAAAELLENHDVDASLVLIGDPDQLEPAAPGRFFHDLDAGGTVPVVRLPVDTAGDDAPIVRLVESLRTGELPPIESEQQAVVVCAVADAAEAIARVVELVTETLPRGTGVGPSDLAVLGIRSAGAAGVEALREAVGSAGVVSAVHEAVGSVADAVVVVLPAESAGSLTRAHLITAASVARRQLTIVHQAGPALADAVHRRPHRRRRTRLAALLEE